MKIKIGDYEIDLLWIIILIAIVSIVVLGILGLFGEVAIRLLDGR